MSRTVNICFRATIRTIFYLLPSVGVTGNSFFGRSRREKDALEYPGGLRLDLLGAKRGTASGVGSRDPEGSKIRSQPPYAAPLTQDIHDRERR